MNNKIIWGIVVVAIAAAGLYYWSAQQAPATAGSQTGTVSQNNTGGTDAMNTHDAAMTGTWKSNDDPKFTRTFNADGTVTDAYTGDASATETGTYVTVDPLKETIPDVPAASLTGMTVLKLTFPRSGVLYFSVNSLSETGLTLTYLGRGNILSFTKVQ